MELELLSSIVAVRYVRDYILELTFDDGTSGELDFAWVLEADGVFEPLHDVALFRQVRVERDFGTIEWPNGVDLCPDVLYHDLTGAPLPGMEPAERA